MSLKTFFPIIPLKLEVLNFSFNLTCALAKSSISECHVSQLKLSEAFAIHMQFTGIKMRESSDD
jgi:hypothetical protein